jgi:hypothetical protein
MRRPALPYSGPFHATIIFGDGECGGPRWILGYGTSCRGYLRGKKAPLNPLRGGASCDEPAKKRARNVIVCHVAQLQCGKAIGEEYGRPTNSAIIAAVHGGADRVDSARHHRMEQRGTARIVVQHPVVTPFCGETTTGSNIPIGRTSSQNASIGSDVASSARPAVFDASWLRIIRDHFRAG